jgi:hypothetical protein
MIGVESWCIAMLGVAASVDGWVWEEAMGRGGMASSSSQGVCWFPLGFRGMRCSRLSVEASWKAKCGMKPGDEARSEPFTRLPLRRRRSRKQQPKRTAATARIPRGIPTPNPIFWFFVRPVVLAAGASGSEVADDVEDDVADGVEDDVAEDVEDDVGTDVESDVESEVEADAEADVGDGVAEESVGREEASDALDTGKVLDSVKLSVVVDAVLSALETGEDVSHAVSGPNSWTR